MANLITKRELAPLINLEGASRQAIAETLNTVLSYLTDDGNYGVLWYQSTPDTSAVGRPEYQYIDEVLLMVLRDYHQEKLSGGGRYIGSRERQVVERAIEALDRLIRRDSRSRKREFIDERGLAKIERVFAKDSTFVKVSDPDYTYRWIRETATNPESHKIWVRENRLIVASPARRIRHDFESRAALEDWLDKHIRPKIKK